MTAHPTTPIDPRAASLRSDLLSAYIASGSKILSWAVVSAALFRHDRDEFAMLALVRATVGILNYTSLGLAPAIIHMLPLARSEASAAPAGPPIADPKPVSTDVLPYARPMQRFKRHGPPVPVLYANAWAAAIACGLVGLILVCIYGFNFERWHVVVGAVRGWDGMGFVVLVIGAGVVLRLVSDAAGAMLQASQRISLDNAILAGGELLWLVLALRDPRLARVSEAFLFSSFAVLAARCVAAARLIPDAVIQRSAIAPRVIGMLLSFGLMVTVAQVADYLYAPTDYILITRLLPPSTSQGVLAAYAPAVQIDAALLVLVSGLASVLLPKAAIAHAADDVRTLRAYYIKGTLASLGLLLAASAVVYALSPWIFRLWLGDSMPDTRAILPLILLDTAIGGSSAVGRSILLGMGKVRAFAASVLVAGVTNVICSYYFVTHLHLGLRGIVLGTVVAVIGRCALWTPWYVMRVLRKAHHRRGMTSPVAP